MPVWCLSYSLVAAPWVGHAQIQQKRSSIRIGSSASKRLRACTRSLCPLLVLATKHLLKPIALRTETKPTALQDRASTAHRLNSTRMQSRDRVRLALALNREGMFTRWETERAQTTPRAAVQSNKVYLTPCNARASVHLRLGVR